MKMAQTLKALRGKRLNGSVSVSLISIVTVIIAGLYLFITTFMVCNLYRGIHLAVVQRRTFVLANLRILKLANCYSFGLLKQSHNMCLSDH